MRRRSQRVIERPSLTHFCKTLATLLLGSLSLKILLFKSSFSSSSSSVNSSDLPSCVPVIDSCLTASVLEEIDLNGIFLALRAFLQKTKKKKKYREKEPDFIFATKLKDEFRKIVEEQEIAR